MTLFVHEMKLNIRTFLIWVFCVGLTGFGCLLLFHGLEDEMEYMAGMYAQMGAFSTALGMDKISLSTAEGFYATEIALIYAIGGAMYAAITGAVLLSKEEEGHTAEFLHTLPLGRNYIICWKYAVMAVLIFLFNFGCILFALLGFWFGGEMHSEKEFLLFHAALFLMQLEIGSICFLISSVCRKKQIGAALGLTLLLYFMDLICRIIPDLENLKYITPYHFSNAADIFTESSVNLKMTGISIGITCLCTGLAFLIYNKRDIAA